MLRAPQEWFEEGSRWRKEECARCMKKATDCVVYVIAQPYFSERRGEDGACQCWAVQCGSVASELTVDKMQQYDTRREPQSHQIHHTPYTIHHAPYTIHHTPYNPQQNHLSISSIDPSCRLHLLSSTREADRHTTCAAASCCLCSIASTRAGAANEGEAHGGPPSILHLSSPAPWSTIRVLLTPSSL